MKAYSWLIELAAVGGLILLVRWALQWRKERDKRADARPCGTRIRPSPGRERDRLDCLALEMKLSDDAPSDDSPAQTLEALRESRRGTTRDESSFDPDLPARVKSA